MTTKRLIQAGIVGSAIPVLVLLVLQVYHIAGPIGVWFLSVFCTLGVCGMGIIWIASSTPPKRG